MSLLMALVRIVLVMGGNRIAVGQIAIRHRRQQARPLFLSMA